MTSERVNTSLHELADIAEQAALAAGRIIALRRRTEFGARYKPSGESVASQVVTDVDHLAQSAILTLLQPNLRGLRPRAADRRITG